jgi:O-antigen ligase
MLLLMRSSTGLRRFMPFLVITFAALLLVYSLAVLRLVPDLDFVLTPITTLTGKDMTFSGRTAIWDIINERILQHPWLGGGYGAYWTGNIPGTPSYEFVTRLNFYPTQTHNGYLDIINDLGVPGGICLVAFLIAYVRQGLRLLPTNPAASALFLGLFFQQLVANLSEARWFNSLSVDFAIVALASLAMSRILLNQKLQVFAGNGGSQGQTPDLPATHAR